MKATWRHVSAPRPPELSWDMPVQFRPSSGTWFHSLQATSHALQPMHSEVSVKKPMRGGWSLVARARGRVGAAEQDIHQLDVTVTASFPSAR